MFVKMLRRDVERLVGFIEKPFEKEEIVSTASRVIRKTRKIRSHKKRITDIPKGDERLAQAYEAWSRSKMIHDRFLDKLLEVRSAFDDGDQKLARLRSLKKGEEKTIDQLNRKGKEVLGLAGLEDITTV